MFAKDVTYANGIYTLSADRISKSGTVSTLYNESGSSAFKYYHYTCLTSGSTCSSVYYVFSYWNPSMGYIKLTNGRKIEDQLDELLNNDGSVGSTAYTELNTWYSNNLSSYSDYLEDTIFCNDRSISDIGGWDPTKANNAF